MFYSLSIYLEYKVSVRTLADLPTRCSHRLQILSPHSPPTMEGNEGETMENPASIDSHVEDVPVTRIRE